MKLIPIALLATTVGSGMLAAQTTTPPTSPPPASVQLDAAAEAKFKAADKDNNGRLSGAEATAYKSDMAKIDTDKDGAISRAEFADAVKKGLIK